MAHAPQNLSATPPKTTIEVFRSAAFDLVIVSHFFIRENFFVAFLGLAATFAGAPAVN